MLHSVAPGRGGGDTYATPPRGQSTIWFACPPTCRQASAWPNSCTSTIKNRAKYSSTGQTMEEYLPARRLMPYTAIRNHDQCKYTSIPAKRNKWKDPCRVGVIGHDLAHGPVRQQAFIFQGEFTDTASATARHRRASARAANGRPFPAVSPGGRPSAWFRPLPRAAGRVPY